MYPPITINQTVSFLKMPPSQIFICKLLPHYNCSALYLAF